MKILTAEFVTSADGLKTCPDFKLPEIAMIGRSNVGKSSFINTLVNKKNMARTSNTPGKTRLINFYNINNKFIITDLPGYGYAKISKTEQAKWKKNLEDYLLNRDTLDFVFHLIDTRHEVQANDLQMREWLNYNDIPVITIATKSDQLSKYQAIKSTENMAKALQSHVIMFASSKEKTGKDEVLRTIEETLFDK